MIRPVERVSQHRVGVHDSQALVLINHCNASGEDILALASQIQKDVHDRYNIELEIEPRVFFLIVRINGG